MPPLRLIQFLEESGRPRVGWVTADGVSIGSVGSFESTYVLAQSALAAAEPLDAFASRHAEAATRPYSDLLRQNRLLPPFSHPDPSRCLVSGTGLTHYGSASARDSMHRKLAAAADSLSDSMQMFKWGVEGGRPDAGPGAQPEWFYKGDGDSVVGCGQALPSPSFALVTERKNYLYLAHSKLRACAVGPELRTGMPPAHMEGVSRIRRASSVIWERPFLTGEKNMCHSLANLEYHHFKYAAHRRPGDVHLHFFGTATLSFADGVAAMAGDVFEVELPELGATLTNPLANVAAGFEFGGVRAL